MGPPAAICFWKMGTTLPLSTAISETYTTNLVGLLHHRGSPCGNNHSAFASSSPHDACRVHGVSVEINKNWDTPALQGSMARSRCLERLFRTASHTCRSSHRRAYKRLRGKWNSTTAYRCHSARIWKGPNSPTSMARSTRDICWRSLLPVEKLAFRLVQPSGAGVARIDELIDTVPSRSSRPGPLTRMLQPLVAGRTHSRRARTGSGPIDLNGYFHTPSNGKLP